jgi:uroporphyrinogen decarboxylase
MTPRERVLKALNCEEPDRVPFMDYFNTSVQHDLMGRNDFDIAEFADEIGMDGIYFTDYVAPVFCKSHTGNGGATQGDMAKGDIEFLGEGLIKTEEDLHLMEFPDPKDDRLYDAAKRFVDRHGKNDLAIYAAMRPLGLFNVIFSMPMMDFAIALDSNLPLINTMMDKFVEWNCTVIEKLQTTGIDFILANCDMAFNSGPLINPVSFREIFLPKMKIVADTIKIPWVFHSDGDLNKVFDDLLTLGMNGMNPFQPPMMNIAAIKKKYGHKLCLWGNIDLVYTLTRGTPEEVDEEVRQRIREVAPGGGYICASANSIMPSCKKENIHAMLKAIKKYGKYPINC